MSISVITNFDVNTSANIDARLGPYVSVAHATGSIPTISRYVGMTVIITGSGAPVEYWFSPTTASTDLVLKSGGGVGGSGTPGTLPIWSTSTTLGDSRVSDNGSSIEIGPNLLINNNNNTSGSYLSIASNYLTYHIFGNTNVINSGESASFIDLRYNNKLSTAVITYTILTDGWGRTGTIHVYQPYSADIPPSNFPFTEQTVEVYSSGSNNTEDIYFDFIQGNDPGSCIGYIYNYSSQSAFLNTEFKIM